MTRGETYIFLLYWSSILSKTSKIPAENVFKYHSANSLYSLVTFPGLPYLSNILCRIWRAHFLHFHHGKSTLSSSSTALVCSGTGLSATARTISIHWENASREIKSSGSEYCVNAKYILSICFWSRTDCSDWSGSKRTHSWYIIGNKRFMASFSGPRSSGFLYSKFFTSWYRHISAPDQPAASGFCM